jgi:hypothetical protein
MVGARRVRTLASQLDGVRVVQLVRRKPAPHPGIDRELAQHGAGGGR